MKVTVRSRVLEIDANADFYELFDMPGREEAARNINQAIIDAAAYGGATRRDCNKAAMKMMEKYADFGALDSEGYRAVDAILDQIFGVADR